MHKKHISKSYHKSV